VRRRRDRYRAADLTIFAIVAVVVLVLGLSSGSGRSARPQVTVRVGDPPGGRPIPFGFLGLSLEYPAVQQYAGTDPAAVNPVFEHLIGNLSPGQAPALRIGGDSTDYTWWPVAGTARPAWARFVLSRTWLQVARTLFGALGARVILGINLEADSSALAAAEARGLVAGLGSSVVRALELGNEPELYNNFAWYHTSDGQSVMGRPKSYGFASFTQDFAQVASAVSGAPLAGPAISGTGWPPHLAQFISAVPQLRLLTLHRYPLQLCFVRPSSPLYPSIAHLLSGSASTGLADGVAPYAALAHAHGVPMRFEELNTVACGADRAVSQTFAAALWAPDALFELVRVGIDGVNIHTFPGAGYELFSFSKAGARWVGSVSPEYYGLLLFAEAAPAGSRLLPVSAAGSPELKVWATMAPDHRLRVLLINKGSSGTRTVGVRLAVSAGHATLERLTAPSVVSRTGIELGGRGFGAQTATGTLVGSPKTDSVRFSDGRYVITLPSASAALLTVTPR
jgi:hypothetical protein